MKSVTMNLPQRNGTIIESINEFIGCPDKCMTLSNRSHSINRVDQLAGHFSCSAAIWSVHSDFFFIQNVFCILYLPSVLCIGKFFAI